MDPRFLSLQIAAGILIAGFVILLLKLGLNIYRNNHGVREAFGAVMFFAGLLFGTMVMLAGFGG